MTAITESRLMTLHPEGKQGVNILQTKYDAIRDAILDTIPDDDLGVALSSIAKRIAPNLPADLFPKGKGITWYVMAVKLDLEARGVIERTPRSGPQHIRLPRSVS
ncbi:MAG: hypothetical protein ACFCBV_10270 [Phycisphaerales bacterium]